MKIEELIEELEKIKRNNGNIEVYIDDTLSENQEYVDFVAGVNVSNKGEEKIAIIW